MTQIPSRKSLMDELEDVRRRLEDLEAAPRLPSSSIDSGRLTVNAAANLNLQGVRIDVTSNYFSTFSTSFTTLANGPQIDVTVGPSGQLLVMFGALVSAYGNGGTNRVRSQMAYDITGATTQSAVVQGVVEVDITGSLGDSTWSNGARADFLTGLNEGDTSLESVFRAVEIGTSPGNPAEFVDPWLLAIPL